MRGDAYFKLFAILVVIVLVVVGFRYFNYDSEEVDEDPFEVDTLFLKLSLKAGSDGVNIIKVTNTDGVTRDFSIGVENVLAAVSLSEHEFTLASRESKEIEVGFSTLGVDYGVYLGTLKISSLDVVKRVPVVLEVQSEEVYFDSNLELFPKGESFYPGEKITSEIGIFDLANVGRKNVELSYFIKGFDNGELVFESETLIVDKQLDISKSLDLPENVRKGDYVLGVVLKQGDSVGTSSIVFGIVDENEVDVVGGSGFNIVIVAFGVLFLLFLGLFFYSLFYRNSALKELKKQYKRDLRQEREIMRLKMKQDYAKLGSVTEKKVYRKEFKKARVERVKAVKDLYKKRVKKVKALKKKGSAASLNRQLASWKRKGYNTRVLEAKFKSPSVKSIKNKVKEWKKKGYDTSVLKKRK